MRRAILVGSVWLMACGSDETPEVTDKLDAGASATSSDGGLDAAPRLDSSPPTAASDASGDATVANTTPSDAEVSPQWPPSCGERMKVSVFATPVDFGASSPRAAFRLSSEIEDGGVPIQEFQRPDAGVNLRWRGVASSPVALLCGPEGKQTCPAEGSQIRLEDRAGKLTSLFLHFRPEEIPAVADGSPVSLTADVQTASLALADASGRLILGVVRNGSMKGYGARSWTFADVSIRSENTVCVADEPTCNWRLAAQNIVANAGASDTVIAPGASAQVTGTGTRYRIVNHAAVQFGTVTEAPSCAAFRLGLDSISVLRQ